MLRIAVLVVSLATVAAFAQDSPPRGADLVARNSYAFESGATTLQGAGADILRKQTAGAQFVLLGDGYRSYADYPAWLHPLLPAEPPRTPTIVDLRALRPYQRVFREGVAPPPAR